MYLLRTKLFACVLLLQLAPGQTSATTATEPRLDASAWVLVDHDSGQIIVSHNSNKPLPPASLTKLLVAYLTFNALDHGKVALQDEVSVSRSAAATGGASIQVKQGDVASLSDLIHGMLIHSGNDAAVAIAEHISGNTKDFVSEMNTAATELGLKNTHYTNPTGLIASNHYSSAADVSKLAAILIDRFPHYYNIFSQRTFAFRGIKHRNRNSLLWKDLSVDGLKTGYTRAAGYCLVASAKRDGMRLIATVLGTNSETARDQQVRMLLDYGFTHFESKLIFRPGDTAASANVWKGSDNTVSAGVGNNFYVTVPRNSDITPERSIIMDNNLIAPVKKGQKVGTVTIQLGDRILGRQSLIALKTIPEGNIFYRAFDQFRLWTQ